MEKEKIHLNMFQIEWLDSRGGRTLHDVDRDEKGLFVLMTDGAGDIPVYIPSK